MCSREVASVPALRPIRHHASTLRRQGGIYPHLIIRVSRSLDPEKANFLFVRQDRNGQSSVELT
jgi:hypothetical protein